MTSFEDWQRGGARNPFPFATGESFSIWSRTDPRGGTGVPHATLLHGFPTHSLDWARIVRGLDGRVRSLSFDLLGFGSSDKPAGRPYSLMEQADLTEAIWAHHGIERTLLVAHDYSVSIAQELLARRAEGRLAVALTGVVFLNGGLWPDLHRAMPAQIALLDPERGPKVSAAVNEELFTRGLGATFSPDHQPSKAEAHETWLGVALRDGHRRGHELIHYITDRRRFESRWVGALEATDLPKRFVWGVLDPVSGGHVLPRILERFPHDPVTPLPAVGHWPSLEAPDVVVAAILEAVGSA